MKYKTPIIQAQHALLLVKNNVLYRILQASDFYSQLVFDKEMVLTSIYRSEAEYQALYKDAPHKLPLSRPHQHWRAADLRSSIYTEEEIQKLLVFINYFISPKGGSKRVALYHAIPGGSPHFHVQWVPNKDSGLASHVTTTGS